jgi:hypothetical protein
MCAMKIYNVNLFTCRKKKAAEPKQNFSDAASENTNSHAR